MRLLYGLLGLTGMLGIGGATLYLGERWLAEETSRLKGDLLARLGTICAPPPAVLGSAGQTFCAARSCARRKKARALNYLAQARSARFWRWWAISTDHAALERAAPPCASRPSTCGPALANTWPSTAH